MNDRLQKKCFFAATGFHLLLLTILIVGPAFFMSERKADDMPMLDFVPTKTIEEAFSGGGSPQAQPPAPPPPAPQPEAQPPAPAPAPVKLPDPPKVVVKEKAPDPESLEVQTEKKPRKPEVSLKPVVRKPSTTPTKVASTSTEDPEAKARADARAKQIAAFHKSVNNLNAGLSSSTTVEMPQGPGGGGPSYANFLQALRKIYNDAWVVPDGITDDEATVSTSVTIARNGDVIATKILRSSGNAAVDASVEAMLRRVTRAVPLPDSAKENQRTVTIKFNVKAKLNG
jgi:TonB family protein